MTEYSLTHPDLDFWVDVTVHERDGRLMAIADLAEDSRDVAVGDAPQEAVRAALRTPWSTSRSAAGWRVSSA